jgi:hypothetical protein
MQLCRRARFTRRRPQREPNGPNNTWSRTATAPGTGKDTSDVRCSHSHPRSDGLLPPYTFVTNSNGVLLGVVVREDLERASITP